MCGIVGIVGQQDESWIQKMNGVQRHRGPDDEGVFRDPSASVSLAMRRLAIIDVKEGHQPMTTGDGRFTIVYNGEIYNAPELREPLEKGGVQFTTDHSDTEVILQLFAREGISALSLFNGMFAFAIYDQRDQVLWCARDHMGIKPFYYTLQRGRFAFSSEMKSLLTLPWISRSINAQSLFHYLSLQFVPLSHSILQGIQKLPPAHLLRFDCATHALAVERWWHPMEREVVHGISRPEWVHRVREEFYQAVARWTLSDVPIACSLSGGLDSSAIVGAMSSQGRSVQTFSVGFEGAEEKDYNELPLTRHVSQRWATEHHELVLSPAALLKDVLRIVWSLDEPYAGGLPSWTVYQFMSTSVKVGMTGTGGDELFGGYGKWTSVEPWWRVWHSRSHPISPEVFRRQFFERWYYWGDAEKRASVFMPFFCDGVQDTSDILFHHIKESLRSNARDQLSFVDCVTQLPEEFLLMTDRFSMAFSLEARTPLLDRQFVELVLSIPSDIRTSRGDLKGFWREVISPLLPIELHNAPKRGFVLPLPLWLRSSLKPLVEKLLSTDRLVSQGIFQPSLWDEIVYPYIEGKGNNWRQIWILLMFQLWHHLFIERTAVDEPAYSAQELLR